jgi:hypothetical protein
MKKKVSGRIIIPLIVIIIGGIVAISYIFRGTENSVGKEKAVYTLTTDELFSAFEENETTANEKFLGKVIEVTGKVSEIEKTDKGQLVIVLSCNSPMGGVRCTFETNQKKILNTVTKGTIHTVKGKCSGMLMEVVFDNCSLTN